MKIKDTYYIKRDGIHIWLAQDIEPLSNDEVVEVRPMIFANEGKVLVKNDEIIGQVVWLCEGNIQDDYSEIEEPIEVESDYDEEFYEE